MSTIWPPLTVTAWLRPRPRGCIGLANRIALTWRLILTESLAVSLTLLVATAVSRVFAYAWPTGVPRPEAKAVIPAVP